MPRANSCALTMISRAVIVIASVCFVVPLTIYIIMCTCAHVERFKQNCFKKIMSFSCCLVNLSKKFEVGRKAGGHNARVPRQNDGVLFSPLGKVVHAPRA